MAPLEFPDFPPISFISKDTPLHGMHATLHNLIGSGFFCELGFDTLKYPNHMVIAGINRTLRWLERITGTSRHRCRLLQSNARNYVIVGSEYQAHLILLLS